MKSGILKILLSISMVIGLFSPVTSYAYENGETAEAIDSDVYVIGEDESKRTESSKTFIMSDRSFQKIIYSIPVHYENSDGMMVEIDSTPVSSSSEDDMIVTADSPMKAGFHRNPDHEHLGEITYGKYKLSWNMRNVSSGIEALPQEGNPSDDIRFRPEQKARGEVRYDDIMDCVSLRYAFDSVRVKEDIIIDEYTGMSNFIFTYRAENLELVKNQDIIEARDDSTGEVIFTMPAPYMYDSDGEVSYDVFYSLEEYGNIYEITISADEQWLKDEQRVYPVVIDPVVQTETTKTSIDTTFIASWKGSTNFSNKRELLVGIESSEYGYCRTLVKFELPELSREIW